MADSSGLVFKDLLPIPDDADRQDPDQVQSSVTMMDAPTESHALAMAEPEEKGAAQEEHEEEVVDLGWNKPTEEVPKLVGKLPNEELWLLVRRFNKQMYHVKEFPHPVPGNLDLNVADEDEFSPDKLRSTIERLYMTIIIGLLGFVKQMARLRSWRETKRTAWFCSAYFVAWSLDLLVPLFIGTIITLLAYEPSRNFLFPPAPIALVDSSTGGVQKPKAGVLGSHDSATGAPENFKGEAVEQEANNFVNGIASVALSSATGKHPQDEKPEDKSIIHDTIPDPTSLAVGAADAKDKANGAKTTASHDKTKVPMEAAMWTKMRPIMHGLTDVVDTWERFANALSPTPPFPQHTQKYRLAAVVAPLFLVSLFTTSYMVVKGTTFGIGFGFFGDPIITPGINWLNSTFPNWQKLLEMRNTLLKGVPTNAQLTITLLRIGEANKAPLPPPPRTSEAPPDRPAEVTEEHLRATGAEPPLNATAEELDEAMAHDPTVAPQTDGKDIDSSKASKHGKRGSRILNLFKGGAKASVSTAIGADKLKATVGSQHAKNRVGVVQPKNENVVNGPVEFKGRYHGGKGHVYITTKATIPCVAFSTDSSIEKIGTQEREDLHPAWSIPIGDIKELKKIGGYGWKAKLVVGWALDRQVNDGLEITDKEGKSRKVTALPLRDELFNRLIAMGGQKWESL